ncbi:MAG: HAD hydrolase-like protein [Tannerella sp.]|jgi:phosphoglycolate phosphatase|nr:HAD hydrolase-like protein [Tannerella sp.]
MNMILNTIDTLVWDWNGTLLDDVEMNLKVVNRMLSKRKLKQLSLYTYRDLFCFPVQSFHRKVGFDFEKESIEEISSEYHAIYKEYKNEKKLNIDALFILDTIGRMGIKQYILSAAKKNDLLEETGHFEIINKFEGIYGADDICAVGKIQIGELLVRENQLIPEKTLIIGDTLHDAEVAKALGMNHILYSGGHNNDKLLAGSGKVITGLKEITA